MKTRFDIAVIGGGVIGLTLARRLAGERMSVTVCDAPHSPAATAAAAGMLAPSFEEDRGCEALYELSTASLRLWPAFAKDVEEESGLGVDYRDDGILGVALDDAGAKRLREQQDALAARGADVVMLSGADARALEPALSDNVAAAMLAPSDAQVDPKKLLPALKAILKKRGAAVFDKQVEHASREEGSWRLLFSDGDGVLAGGIVAATGAGPHWPLDSIARPPIYPVKGEAYSTEARANSLLTRVVRGPGAYLCPKTGGRIVVGASEAPNRDDISVSESAISALKDAAAAVAPAMAEMREDSRWAGLRPATPDGAPILGPDRTAAGVFYALGHHRNGVLLAPASAEALAAAILGRPCPFDMSPFRADRFG